MATAAAARARAPADRDRLAAAGPDAQPDRGRRAGRHPRGDDQLHQRRAVGADPRDPSAGRGRRAAGQARAAQQPRVPRRGAAPAGRDLRAAGGRRGALHLRLGPRLPPRLPPDPHPAGRPPDGIPVLATTATANARVTATSPSSCGGTHARRPRAPRVARPGVAAARRGPAPHRRAAAGLAGRPPRRAARLGHRLLPDGRRHPGDRRLPPLARARTSRLLRRRPRPPSARPSSRTSLAGRVKALVATSALGMGFDATLGFVVNLGAPASPVAYYQQVGRAGRGAAADRGRHASCCCPATEDRDIWAYFASLAFPREELVRAHPRGARRRGPTAEHRHARDARRPQPQPPRDACSRCSTSTAPYAGCAAAGRRPASRGSYDEERYDRVARGPGARAAGDARLPRDRRLPDALPARAARRPGRQPTADAATTAVG